MLTERKMFSSSLVISATSGLETRTTCSQTADVELGRTLRALAAVIPPTTFGVLRIVKSVRPGIDALGRERDVQPVADLQAAAFEKRHEPLAGRARIGRRLQHDKLIALDDVAQGARGADQRLEVRLAIGRQRSRDADRSTASARASGAK